MSEPLYQKEIRIYTPDNNFVLALYKHAVTGMCMVKIHELPEEPGPTFIISSKHIDAIRDLLNV